VAASYLNLYAVTTLTSTGLLNFLSCIALLAYWRIAWARKMLAIGADKANVVLLVVFLLVAHLLYFQWRKRKQTLNQILDIPPPSRWIAGVYIIVSFVSFIFITLAPAALR
jgi:hypothetical protein